jgi:hypothetical protein
VHINRPLHFFILDSFSPRYYELLPEDYTRLRPLFQSMQNHPVPLVQDYGAWGEIWLTERCGGPSPSLEEFKTLVRKHIEQPGGNPDDPARGNHYAAMLDALRYLTLGDAQRRQERYELLQFMLDRKEMVRCVVDDALSAKPVDRQEARQQVALIDRVEAVLNKGPHALNGAPGRVSAEIHRELGNWRERIEADWPDLARVASPVPWTQARPLLRRGDLDGIGSLTGPLIHQGALLVAGAGTFGGSGKLEAFRVPLDRGPVQSLGKIADYAGQPRVTTVCAGGGYYFVACSGDGIYAFPLAGGPPQHIDENQGLPSNRVRAMTWLDGRLYAALADGEYLVRCDPRGGPCVVLASSRRKERLSPLDDTPPYDVAYLAGDPQRRRLLLTIRFKVDDAERRKANGLWQYEPAAGEFKQVLEIEDSPMQTSGGTQVQNDAIMLWFYDNWVIRIDLKTDTPAIVHTQMAGTLIPGLHSRGVPYRNFAGTAPPYAEADGWLWSVQGMFARLSNVTGTVERLPSLETGRPGAKYQYLEMVGDDSHLLVGDDSGFWLLMLKDKHTPQP